MIRVNVIPMRGTIGSKTMYWPQFDTKNVASKAMSEIEYVAPDSMTIIRMGDSVCDFMNPAVRRSEIHIFPAIRLVAVRLVNSVITKKEVIHALKAKMGVVGEAVAS